jgi:hypothetical protein
MKLASVLRDRRLRHAHGYTSISLVAVVLSVTGLVAVGHGPVSTVLHLADGSAWLGNSKKGTVTLVNGSSGLASATVGVGSNGHRLGITQTGDGVVVTDLDTGEVRRVDPANLRVSQSVAYDAADLDIVQHGGMTYAVDHRRGRVIRVDSTTLRPIGDAVALPGQVSGNVVFDRAGVLWVAVEQSGAVYPIGNGRLGRPITVAEAGSRLLLSRINGRPTIIVPDRQAVLVLEGARIARTFTVPEVAGGDSQVPAEVDGPTLPVVSTATGQLVVLDTVSGTRRAAAFQHRFRRHELGAPTVLASRVYVPDYSTGSVIVYDAAASRFAGTIRATGHPGKFDAFAKGGYLWLNDQRGSRAVVVSADGRARSIDKYALDVARPQPAPRPPRLGNRPPEQPNGPSPGPPGIGPPVASLPSGPPRSGPPATPGVPVSVEPTPGDASIAASWIAPASGAAVRSYVATAHPVGGGRTVTARTRRAVTSISVPGLQNGVAYTLTVHAVGAAGRRGADSVPTAPVTPLPGRPVPPSAVRATPGNALVDLTWQPSTGHTLQPIKGYRVYLERADTRTVVSQTEVTGASSTSTQLTGLANGTAYVVEVSAYTATTESGRAASEAFTPATVPAAPVITNVTPGPYQVTLSWSLPNDGGSPVDRYTVVVDGAEYATTASTDVVIGPRRGDRSFAVQVFAHNAVGGGPGSPNTPATPGVSSYANWDHYMYPASIRSAPTQSSSRLGYTPVVPSGRDGELMPVYCQAAGTYFNDPGTTMRSHIWDYINYRGIVGYVNDMYVHTPGTNSDRFSDGIARC